jgi:predicted dienelactone hydrolase
MILKNEILDFSIPPNPIVTYSPIVFAMPERQVPLQMKVSAPATGTNLPIILLSHGHGQSNFLASLHGYAPLVNFYASKGFVVIQPTHQNSKSLQLTPTEHDGDLFWRSRAEDMHFILDILEKIKNRVPFFKGRLNKEKIAAVGHSLVGRTVSLLTGMLIKDPKSGEETNYNAKRIKASFIMRAPGNGADLAPAAAKRFPNTDA